MPKLSKTKIASFPISTVSNMKQVVEHIVENESYKQDWIETIEAEGWEYGKKALYYMAKKSLMEMNENKNVVWISNYLHSDINFEDLMKSEYSQKD